MSHTQVLVRPVSTSAGTRDYGYTAIAPSRPRINTTSSRSSSLRGMGSPRTPHAQTQSLGQGGIGVLFRDAGSAFENVVDTWSGRSSQGPEGVLHEFKKAWAKGGKMESEKVDKLCARILRYTMVPDPSTQVQALKNIFTIMIRGEEYCDSLLRNHALRVLEFLMRLHPGDAPVEIKKEAGEVYICLNRLISLRYTRLLSRLETDLEGVARIMLLLKVKTEKKFGIQRRRFDTRTVFCNKLHRKPRATRSFHCSCF
ncbi:hypothetical protein BOTBODRAFT_609859 [Botryobasidium botryosum FD-172 SS1]|uniref:Uncharacterized protein n=1 Tax=Botryobasidium botryosum (strain FD-172 SS1) TaxID=930990 RepID=A0A067M6D5_BOTB1|nr:hypothetical protein BOTBODRAFT_609859 [Botryobasidium botryosum FD-172 SS1]